MKKKGNNDFLIGIGVISFIIWIFVSLNNNKTPQNIDNNNYNSSNNNDNTGSFITIIVLLAIGMLFFFCNYKPSIKKNCKVYKLLDEGDIVYIGQSNNTDRRMNEHEKSGKNFCMVEESYPRTEKRARMDEKKLLAEYEEKHGELPKYNKKHGG